MAALTGKVALVTGGGSGLGRAIVGRFIREGASVGVLEQSPQKAADLANEFDSARLSVTVGDVRNPEDNRRAVGTACERFGKLDIFVGNAGIYDNRVPLADIPLESVSAAFDELFAVNVKGYLLGVRAAIEELRRSKGCIIFTASVSSFSAGFGGVLYVASKHAIAGLTRQLAWELGPDIRVNAVAPGYAPTELRGLESLGQGKSGTAPAPENLPLQRISSAEDYADLYVLLASDTGRIATGSVFVADGGLSVAGPAFRGREQPPH
jgi:NAD(P)-dependent dehydrogenase (short-subunit alcohol dehydrogenase family)